MLVAATGGKAMWYLTRGTGVIALLLLTVTMLLGILEVKRWQSPGWPRFVTAGLHRYLSLLSVAFVAAHVATTVIDGFAPIGWLDAIVPFRSPYRPVWLGLGAVSVDLLIALVVTSLLRGRLGYQAWRAVHWAAYACWPTALVHGLGTGTDVPLGWAIGLNLACLVAVILALWWRLAEAWDSRRPTSDPAVAGTPVGVVASAMVASVVMPVAVVAWLLLGPLQPGWAKRAGTPRVLQRSLSAGTSAAIAPAASAVPATSDQPPLPSGPSTGPTVASAYRLPATADLLGRRTETVSANGQATVTIDTTLRAEPATRLVVILHGLALADGGIAMRSSQVTVGPATDPSHYQGTVTALQGSHLTLALTGPDGAPIVLTMRLAIVGGAVNGTMAVAGRSG